MRYIERCRPAFVGLKNVKGLMAKGPNGMSNLDVLLKRLTMLGILSMRR